MNWNSLRWGKHILYRADYNNQGRTKISCTSTRRSQRTNQGSASFICTPWVPIHLSFNSQQGPPLPSLSGCESMLRRADMTWAQMPKARIDWTWPASYGVKAQGRRDKLYFCGRDLYCIWSLEYRAILAALAGAAQLPARLVAAAGFVYVLRQLSSPKSSMACRLSGCAQTS